MGAKQARFHRIPPFFVAYNVCLGVIMAFIMYNPNPSANRVGDCVIRAISKLMGQDWDDTYLALSVKGFVLKDMPSANHVWGSYLKDKGFYKYPMPDACPDCYTVREFCDDNPFGEYLLATGSHVVAVCDGDYYDSWDSGGEVPTEYWMRGE